MQSRQEVLSNADNQESQATIATKALPLEVVNKSAVINDVEVPELPEITGDVSRGESIIIESETFAPQSYYVKNPQAANEVLVGSAQSQEIITTPVIQEAKVSIKPVELKSTPAPKAKIISEAAPKLEKLTKQVAAPIKEEPKNNTMEFFLAEAYRNNPEINSARATLKRAHESLPQAYAGYLPSVEYNLSNSYQDTGFVGNTRREIYTDSKSLDIRQEIFGGGETYYAVKSALQEIDAAEQSLVLAEQTFFFSAISAYIEAIFTDKVYKLSVKNEEIIKRQSESTKQRFIVGDATKTDVAQGESRYANSRFQAVSSYNDYIAAKATFRRIFLVNPTENLSIPSNLPKIPENLDAVLQVANKKNPALKRDLAQKMRAEYGVDVSKSQLFPQVDLIAASGERESVTGTNIFDTRADSVSLNVRIPLYNRGATYSAIRESQDIRRGANYDYENRKNIIRDEITRSWQTVKTNEQNVGFAKASLVAAQFAVQGIIEEQKQGVRLIQDIFDAERERFSAEINYARAIRDSIISIYNLKSLMGELTAEELNLPVASYDYKKHFDNTKFKLFGF